MKPENSYMFGFFQTDGHLSQNTRNRGRLSVEIKLDDKSLLDKFKQLICVNSSITTRSRNTNFKENYKSIIWTVCDLEFRTTLNTLGLPYGRKSKIIKPPTVPFLENDYWRGIIDGDGSLGMTATKPFISLVTSSQTLAEAYIDFVFRKTGQYKTNNPNKRDKVYNICVYGEDAQKIIHELYYPECLCLDRKLEESEIAKSWVRPSSMKRRTWKVRKWTKQEDFIVLNYPIEIAMKKLDRTERSVSTRAWRLRLAA
jgi:hypothetical protein